MTAVAREVTAMQGADAPPRRNGELVFDAPWQGRVFALAIGVHQRLGIPWDDFRRQLGAEIERDPARAYYESWLAALEALMAEHGLT